MNTITQVFNQLPSPMRNSCILCFNSWEDPDEFYTMGKVKRMELYHKFKKLGVEPTETNYWIWFGAYSPKRYQARYYDLSVSSLLYNVFIEKTNSRLYAKLATTRSDVNPYKYMHGDVKMKEVLKNLRDQSIPIGSQDPYHPVRSHNDTKLKNYLDKIDDLWDDKLGLTREWYLDVLLPQGYDKATLEKALDSYGLK